MVKSIEKAKMLKEKNLKTIVHGTLAALAIVEAFDCKSRTRKLITGLCAGWHCHATFYHMFIEKDVDNENEKK